MDDASPALEVGFQIDFGDAFGGLKTLDDLIGKAAADGVRSFQQLEHQIAGGLSLGDASVQFRAFGNASSTAMRTAAQAMAQAEKAGESMVKQIERQTEVFGKTSSEVRNMRAELKAAAADAQGLTELGARLRASNAALMELEAGAGGVERSSTRMSASGMEMMHSVRASTDAFAAGIPPMQIFAMEIGRVAEAASFAGGGTGVLGTIGGFLAGPWGIALTVGAAVLGPLVAGLFDTSEAAKKAADALEKFEERQADMGRFIDANTGRLKEQSRVLAQIAVQQAGSQLLAAAKPGQDAVSGAFAAARAKLADAGSSRAGPNDVDLSRVIANAHGNVQLLNQGLEELKGRRKDLAGLTDTVAGFAGQAQEAADNIHRVQGNQQELNTALHGGVIQTSSLVDRQVSLATATTAVERAQARLSDVQARGAAIDELPYSEKRNALLRQYGTDLTAATNGVKAAEAAAKAAKNTGDKHAESLAREAEAMTVSASAAIAAAAGYLTSSAAGATLEARRKALTDATKKGIDVDAQVARQMALAAAETTLNGAKTVAQLGDEAAAHDAVLGKVRDGALAVADMDEALKVDLALRPLLAARTYLHGAALQTLNDVIAAMPNAFKKAQDSANSFDAAKALKAGQDQIDQLNEELRLIGATDEARARSMAEFKEQQRLSGITGLDPATAAAMVKQQGDIAATGVRLTQGQDAYNVSLTLTADKWDIIAGKVSQAGQGMADAFGSAGKAIGDVASTYANYEATRTRLGTEHDAAVRAAGSNEQKLAQANERFTLQSSGNQIAAYGDMLGAAKGFFKEGTAGYDALAAAEKVYRIAQFTMSVAAMVQQVRETITGVASSAARATANASEGISAQAKLPFPFNLVAMAATAAALVATGIAVFGGGSGGGSVVAPPTSEDLQKAAGTGSVLGSTAGQSASIAHSLDLVAKNTGGLLAYSNPMLDALKTINASIGTMTAAVAKQIGVSGSLGNTSNLNIGSSGSAGFLGLFSSSTTRTLYDAGITLAATTVGNIVADGIAGQTYQIVQQVKTSSGFLGIGGGTKTTYQTSTGALPSDITSSIQSVIGALENGIVTAAGAIGVNGAKAMLDNFQVSIGQLSFNGLDAQGISDELNAVFSKVGDQMVQAILPDVSQFQKAGEGLFETLERVASTVVATDTEFRKLGVTTTTLGIAIDMGVAGMFDSVSDFTTAADAYFATYYSMADQTAAKTADMQQVFASLNLTMPNTLASFRALVDAQDLTTVAGQSTYATLLKIAPAFADLQSTLNGAKSAADALSEQQGLLNQLWQLQGDTASIRAAQLATLDPSNRALQEQIYAVQDAQDAAKAASDLADAWKTVGDSIMDEINRIRGLNDTTGDGSFASLMGQFNTATDAARAGDQTAAKNLPALSQALLTAAAAAATSRQELDRVQAQTAASLQSTYDAIGVLGATPVATSSTSDAALLSAAATSQASTTSTAANDGVVTAIENLRGDMAQLRSDMNTGNATIAGGTTKTAKILDQVTAGSGGQAVAMANAA